ncbi:tyrosine-type recombinase/integrase [Paenibacillus sp. GYB003]|uniref:tyrosine-type recombinase/integrase n=1 Tax=Paenibacillus sp. GYB003 TaxID=2994392 RepID=UPI002F9694B6
MEVYISAFEKWLKEEDKAEQTIRSYITTLKSFVRWLEQTEDTVALEKVTPVHLMDYRSYLMNNLEQKPSSVNRTIAALKTFFQWAVDTHLISNDPAQKIKMKRIQQNIAPKWLTVLEQNRLLNVLETERNESKQARDKAVILTMLRAGLRVEEVSDLKINDVDLRQNQISVLDGKGGKWRIIPLHPDLKKAIKYWLTFRQTSDKQTHQESPYLFVSERSGQLTTRGIAFLIDRYLELCGLLERGHNGDKLEGQPSCHSLRHTFCKTLVDRGVSIHDVARLAGHDSIQTTQRYVEPSKDDLRAAINKI